MAAAAAACRTSRSNAPLEAGWTAHSNTRAKAPSNAGMTYTKEGVWFA